MKTLFIILTITVLIFLIIQAFILKSQRNIESQSFSIIEKFDLFEIRNYEASLFSSVTLSTNEYKAASRKGFSILAGYIFGANKSNEKIAMTSPVTMSLEDSMTMMFMVPKNLKKENLPKPNSPLIKFIDEPSKIMAAISFKGWANSEKIEKYKKRLIQALDDKNIPYKNQFYFLGYNPPYEIFNRKNEVIVELKNDWSNALDK